MTVFTLASTSY